MMRYNVFIILTLFFLITTLVNCQVGDPSKINEIGNIGTSTTYKLTEGVYNGSYYEGYTYCDNVIYHSGIEIEGFGKDKALNGVFGEGSERGSLDVFVIGEAKEAIFEFKGKEIVNGEGIDFKVFENPFYINGDPNNRSMDLGLVSVSKDLTNWLTFAVSYDSNQDVHSPIGKSGFCGLEPVFINLRTNNINPKSVQAGGDAFDLSNLGISIGESVKYIKITDAATLYPDGQIESNGVDIDAICAFYWK